MLVTVEASRPARRPRRRGAILPMVAISLIALLGLVALAIDVGMLLVEKTQAQNAADTAAMTGARAIDGSPGGNLANAILYAQQIAGYNSVLGVPVTSSEVVPTPGAYHYDPVQQVFVPELTVTPPDNYSLMQVVVTTSRPSGFARVFGAPTLDVQATAIAAHRPRDICMVLDFSGSMNNETDLWVVEPEYGPASLNGGQSNNTDPVFPAFGPYNPAFSQLAGLQCTNPDPRVGRCNITQAVFGIGPMVNDYFQNPFGSAGVPAFYPAPPNVTNTNPGGDNYLPHKNKKNTPALSWQDITGSKSTAFTGYAAHTGTPFNGWIQGPGYWGKTFFIWPPDPFNDWRKQYFFLSNGTTPLNDDTQFFAWKNATRTGTGLNAPPGNYVINYKAILGWIKANCVQAFPGDNTKPFPPILRAGHILYYSSIPSDITAPGAYNHANPNSNITNNDERFWKEYIDFTLGVWRSPMNSTVCIPNGQPGATCAMGPDFTAGTTTIGGIKGQSNYISTNPDTLDPAGKMYVPFDENPKRPRHTFWFGPMTMVEFMQDTGKFPGTAHDISMFSAKQGIQGALTDIQNNHPNDLVSLILFSRPTINAAGPGGPADPPGNSQFVQSVFSLTKNYSNLTNLLFFPPNSQSQDVQLWDPNGSQTPAAHGDFDNNTATNHGLMMAYNEFSGASYTAGKGGNGRFGASRVVILETDGISNVPVGANFTQNVSGTGVNNSYYRINPNTDNIWLDSPSPGPGAPSFPPVAGNPVQTAAGQAALNIATKLCALTTDFNHGPGFATPAKPVNIHVICFGAVFEPISAGLPEQINAFNLCSMLSQIGGTGNQFPSSPSNTSSPYYYKIVIGNQAQRQQGLKTAFLNILDAEVPVSLVQ
jgi:Flp pilus assembly protein TadG